MGASTQTAAELNGCNPGKVEYIVANLSVSMQSNCPSTANDECYWGCQNKAGCDALITQIKERESKLHILVNNSGITWGAPYEDFPETKGWDNVMAVNVKSIFYSMSLILRIRDFLPKVFLVQ